MTTTRIESYGVYLPEKEVTTKSLVASMETKPMFDLERLTGIKGRRWRAPEDDCHTLALAAVEQCLARSGYKAEQLDVIICTSITRFHGELRFMLEPGLSGFLKQTLGMRTDAINFDITNACAGMFTGLHILNEMIRSGAVKNGLIVSGECITPIAETALKEICSPIDEQFASLTVGDSGAAMILDGHGSVGVDSIDFCDMLTMAEFSDFCFGMPSERNAGVAMYTKAMEIHGTVIQRLPKTMGLYSDRYDVRGTDYDHIIPHQTSKKAIQTALELCIDTFGDLPDFCISLDRFGNTSSTSHLIVLDDYAKQGKIKAGERVFFVVLASGIVLGVTSVHLGKLWETE